MDTKMGTVLQGNKNVTVEVLFYTGQKSIGSDLSLINNNHLIKH